MRTIVYVIKDITVIGGREIITLQKANAFVNLGYRVHIISYENKGNIPYLNEYIHFYNLELDKIIFNKKWYKRNSKLPFFKKRITQIINSIKPDILISLMDWRFYKLADWKFCKNFKTIVEIHGSYEHYKNSCYKKGRLSLYKLYKFFLFKRKLLKFDKVVILPFVDKKKWNLRNLELIPNFCSLEEYLLIKNENKDKRFLATGRFSIEKGFDLLIDVWKIIKDKGMNIPIDIVGEGECKNKIVNKINTYKLHNYINIYDFDYDIKYKINNYYACILPSRFECFPMIILESYNNAVPVISFDLDCGIKELINNNVEGFVINKFNLYDMADKIINIYNNEALRNTLSTNAYLKAEKYKEKVIINKWISLFNSIC